MKNNTALDKKLAKKDQDTYKNRWYMYRYRKYLENKNKPKPDWVPKDLNKECFQCKSSILVKFVIPMKAYSQKNNWEYWTENKNNKDKYMCGKCLIELYNDKFRYWDTITNPKKKQRMKTYVYTGAIFSE